MTQRQRTVRQRRRLLLSALLFVSLAGMSAVTGAFDPEIWFANKSRDAGFVLSHVLIEGHSRTLETDILARLDTDRGAPLMAIDLNAARQGIEALPWVERVRVERRLPDTLAVTVQERVPFALWQAKGAVHLIDVKGVVIPGQRMDEFSGHTLFVGEGANLEAARLIRAIEDHPALAARLRTAVRVGGRRWDMIFEGGVRVKFPEDESLTRFQGVLATFSGLEDEHRLLERDVTVIDLRVPGQLVMRLNPEARHLVNADYSAT